MTKNNFYFKGIFLYDKIKYEKGIYFSSFALLGNILLTMLLKMNLHGKRAQSLMFHTGII